jgi:hypothetical protein
MDSDLSKRGLILIHDRVGTMVEVDWNINGVLGRRPFILFPATRKLSGGICQP